MNSRLAGLAVVAAAGVIYFGTAARDIVVGDTPELAAVALTLGVAHPPGYPLLTLLGYLFGLLPVGAEPFRVNLLSVVAHTVTVGVIYLTALRLTGAALASAAAALALAFNPLFWSWSLALESFPLNDLLAALMVYLLVEWHERSTTAEGETGRRPHPRPFDRLRAGSLPEGEGTRASPLLVGAALVAGLGMANHHTIALLGPAVLYLLWRGRGALARRPWVVGACAAAFGVGLLPYAYVPWAAARDPYWNWMSVSSVGDFAALVTRATYGSGQLIAEGRFQGGSPLARVWALAGSFTLVEVALLLLGAYAAYRERRWYFWFAALGLGFSGVGFAAYANADTSVPAVAWILERFFLLPHVLAAPLGAFGILFAARAGAEMVGRRGSAGWTYGGVAAIVLAAAAAGVVGGYRDVDQSGNRLARSFAEDILSTLEPNAILVANGDEAALPVAYLQAVEGRRPDVTLILAGLLRTDWYSAELRARRPHPSPLPEGEGAVQVPFKRLDGRSATFRHLVAANPGRPVSVLGPVLDDSLRGAYWLYRRGLVFHVEPLERDRSLAELAADNDRLLAGYRPPSKDRIRAHTFEGGVLTQYALPALEVGAELEVAGRTREAREWYERALSIDPGLPAATQALARLAR